MPTNMGGGYVFRSGNLVIASITDPPNTFATSTTPTKIGKTFIPKHAGAIKVSFTLACNGGGVLVNARIYKNGNPTGTLRSTTSGSPILYEESVTVSINDNIEIWAWNTDNAFVARVETANISIDNVTFIVV